MRRPERIGRYRVSRLLGSGAFASVWLGFDDLLGEPVAIKVLADNWATVPDVHSRFVWEARLLRRADSDRVVRMYDIGELPDGRPYFVMSYADRGTVADLMTGPLPVPEALRLAVETARAVAVLHRLGVVHRDIKPSNVLVQSSPGGERIVISDLGVAKHVAQASGYTIAAGTPGYMAPEQAELGLDVDVRADVYGLGALTYHLLTGTKYDAGDVRGIDLPKKVKQVMVRALEPDRERRWPDAAAFAGALAGVLAGLVPDGRSANGDLSRPAVREPDEPTPSSYGSASRPVSRTHAITSASTAPVRGTPARSRPGPKPKRRKRIQLFVLLTVVLLMLAGGGVVAMRLIAVNDGTYFVGEGRGGEIAIFQGKRGSVLGVSQHTQVQGSCPPEVPTCGKFYVDDLTAAGQDTVRSGSRTFDGIPDARGFLQDLRTEYRLPTCGLLAQQRQLQPNTPEPEPGVNCRQPRGDGGSG
ncbi:serine/threonine-protein kinase [Actinophytocola sp.]|uniref:serine/threonine-protein kinase n=1 Tax=Actinophytocola sp. TaxID=1872138 RepID=UPI003D6AF08F